MAETTMLRNSAIKPVPSTAGKTPANVSGAHPVVQVNMNAGGPRVRGGQSVKQGVTILPPKGNARTITTGGLPSQPARQTVQILPPAEHRAPAPIALTADHLLFCRHLVGKYIADQLVANEPAGEESDPPENVEIAEATILAIDATMVAITSAAAAAMTPAPMPASPAVPPRGVFASVRSSQVNSAAAVRRVPRPPTGSPPPPVTVTMDSSGQPVLHDPPASASNTQTEHGDTSPE